MYLNHDLYEIPKYDKPATKYIFNGVISEIIPCAICVISNDNPTVCDPYVDVNGTPSDEVSAK